MRNRTYLTIVFVECGLRTNHAVTPFNRSRYHTQAGNFKNAPIPGSYLDMNSRYQHIFGDSIMYKDPSIDNSMFQVSAAPRGTYLTLVSVNITVLVVILILFNALIVVMAKLNVQFGRVQTSIVEHINILSRKVGAHQLVADGLPVSREHAFEVNFQQALPHRLYNDRVEERLDRVE